MYLVGNIIQPTIDSILLPNPKSVPSNQLFTLSPHERYMTPELPCPTTIEESSRLIGLKITSPDKIVPVDSADRKMLEQNTTEIPRKETAEKLLLEPVEIHLQRNNPPSPEKVKVRKGFKNGAQMKFCTQKKPDSLQFKVVEKLRQSKYQVRSLANTAHFLKRKIAREHGKCSEEKQNLE